VVGLRLEDSLVVAEISLRCWRNKTRRSAYRRDSANRRS